MNNESNGHYGGMPSNSFSNFEEMTSLQKRRAAYAWAALARTPDDRVPFTVSGLTIGCGGMGCCGGSKYGSDTSRKGSSPL